MANIFTRSMGNGGLTSLQTLLGMPDPLLNFKWVCSGLPFGHPVNYVEGIDLPFNNITNGNKSHVASGYSYYPGTHDISSFSMTFYEDVSALSSKFILAWKNKVKDFNTGIYQLPGVGGSGYKQEVVVALLDQKNNPIMEVTLLGVWPTDTGNFNLNYTDSGRLTVTQTFSVDGQEVVFS